MKARRALAYALLSLLLVLSQQMALSHALSHWNDGHNQRHQHAQKALAMDQGCAQCLAFAQIGSALGTRHQPQLLLRASAVVATALPAQPPRRPAATVFQPRAPPVLS